MSRKYTTTQGDTWDLISYKIYKKESYMSQLIEANPEYNKVVFFSAGIILQVPDIVIPEFKNLPPWKR